MSVPFDMLLHPELLSNEQLICIIQERHLRVSNLRHMRRDELLDIFHHYCVPYGQRKYRDSGRGKLLNKNRPPSPEPAKNLNRTNQEVKQSNQNHERLKPPPECMSSFTKRFKIETTITPISNKDFVSVNKRKMSVESVTVSNDCPPPKKERKPITWP
uniref:Ashwin n=1 Tax=Heliothis virescens TaxID=7102 RepID=A0A2A4K790_HELVI